MRYLADVQSEERVDWLNCDKVKKQKKYFLFCGFQINGKVSELRTTSSSRSTYSWWIHEIMWEWTEFLHVQSQVEFVWIFIMWIYSDISKQTTFTKSHFGILPRKFQPFWVFHRKITFPYGITNKRKVSKNFLTLNFPTFHLYRTILSLNW